MLGNLKENVRGVENSRPATSLVYEGFGNGFLYLDIRCHDCIVHPIAMVRARHMANWQPGGIWLELPRHRRLGGRSKATADKEVWVSMDHWQGLLDRPGGQGFTGTEGGGGGCGGSPSKLGGESRGTPPSRFVFFCGDFFSTRNRKINRGGKNQKNHWNDGKGGDKSLGQLEKREGGFCGMTARQKGERLNQWASFEIIANGFLCGAKRRDFFVRNWN